jgi:hypothetical protein
VFGTYHHPAPGVFPAYTGVEGESDGNNLYEAVMKPFVERVRALMRLVRRVSLQR